MSLMLLALSALAASQGQALPVVVSDAAALQSVVAQWQGHNIPFSRVGDHWLAVVGVDLDAAPGVHEVPIHLRFADGRTSMRNEQIDVAAGAYPTTRLQVEPRYVELSAEDQARARRESAEIDRVYSAVSPERLWEEPFLAPVAGAGNGRNFGHRRVFNGQPRAPHSGADLTAATGTPVVAANRGRVVLAKSLFFSGNAVFLDHGLGVYTTYLHLSRIDVALGDWVDRGGQLGLAGATGRVTGPHLHWGARVLDARVDPFSLIGLVDGK
jgi:murein DD-endopeptidase MepM/ murein hydrolase activator NlpD